MVEIQINSSDTNDVLQFTGKISAIVIILVLVLVSTPVQANKKIEIQIWSNPLGSTGYTLSFGLAEIINKYSDKYTASCVETKSQSVNMLHLIKEPSARKNTIIYGNPPGYDNCKFGKPPFDKPYSNFGWISLVGNVIVVEIIAFDRSVGIFNLEDTVVVTEEGFEFLSTITKDPFATE